jgi:glycerophosphoryl diester phosphodiesterase
VILAMIALASAPIVIAHRGASGERPEHTIAAYELAIEQGADFIEPDLVPTKDGVLVARHENEISGTTDVAAHPEFAARKATRTIDGQMVTGWFTEDFTLAELRTLRARERLPQLRPGNTAYDGKFAIPTFDDVIALAKSESVKRGRTIGIYPETKHPGYFRARGLPLEPPLLVALKKAGWTQKTDPVFIQSFEVGNLKALRRRTKVRLVQLMSEEGGPADRPELSYAEMADEAGLSAIAKYADAIGVEKAMVMARHADGSLGEETQLTFDAHDRGLSVHVWTFRAENAFLPANLRKGTDPRVHGDLAAELRAFYDIGVDGVFSDFPGAAVSARDGAALPPRP